MSEPRTKCKRWLVSGRVQGVGFRWFAYRAASRIGLAGRVRNLPDGRVEVVASGLPDELARLADQLRQGPPLARVTGVTDEEGWLPPDLHDFRIDA